MIKLRDMIQRGELGTILHVEATMTFPNALFINPSALARRQAPRRRSAALMPMGVHAIDGMIDLCGPIDHVFAPELPPRRADRRRRHHLDPVPHEERACRAISAP